MTHTLVLLFAAVTGIYPAAVPAKPRPAHSAVVIDVKRPLVVHQQVPSSQAEQHSPAFPAHAKDKPHVYGWKTPHFEELPHIHHFHKERVKKIRRHRQKCWLLTKLVLVLCHLSILWIGYLHLVH